MEKPKKKTEPKKRVPIWMETGLFETTEKLKQTDGSKDRSEFICNAVSFYVGYLQSESSEVYVSNTLLKEMDSRLALHQKNICQTLFKLAVETGMNAHVIAESYENITPDYLKQLRQRCIGEVKKSLGAINFESIIEQKSPQKISLDDVE